MGNFENKVALGLGSNLGNRFQNIQSAIRLITAKNIMSQIKVSSLYKSKALLTENAPKKWNKFFLNCVILGYTSFSPHELLIKLSDIESTLGKKSLGKWGPRTIDIDILIYENFNIDDKFLKVPHKELLNREFVITPLTEIWPDWVCIIEGIYKGITIRDIKNKFFPENNMIKVLSE